MNDWNERNRAVIEEFRANAGRVGDRRLLLLTTKGAKTGRLHTTPLMYLEQDGRISIIASKGGDPANPDWYRNLVANPRVTVEVGGETYEAQARVAESEERDRLYASQARLYPFFAEYQRKVKRQIPVVVLERAAGS